MNHGKIKSMVLALPLASIALSGCATSGQPSTPGQRIAGCGVSLLGGALVGVLIGSAVGGRHGSRDGAVIGTGLGAAGCAVWLAFNNERDRRLMAEAQMRAAQTGRPVANQWQGDDGRMRSVSVVPSTETLLMRPRRASDAAPRLCRTMSTTPSLDGAAAQPISAVYCRTATGDYERVSGAMVAAQ